MDTESVTIEGTNGFGNLLSQDIQAYQQQTAEEESGYEAGCSVTNLQIEGNTATVTYSSQEDAVLVVALYTEDGLQMVTSASTTVTAQDDTAAVTFDGDIPEYFMASAYLMDTYDLSPLCAAYDTPMYTREMKELLASTVDDYDPDRVLNLDDDRATNFAVYADSTIVIQGSEGVNIVSLIDDENALYVLHNADEQITGLQEGDVFVYPYGESEFLIVKVASIKIDGSTATITGGKLETNEVFDIVKIEGSDSTENLVVDASTADEGVTFEGIVDNTNPRALRTVDNEFGTEFSRSSKYSIHKMIETEEGGTTKSVKVAGSLAFSLSAKFTYYTSETRQYIELRIDTSFTSAFTITGKVEHKWKLGKAAFRPVPGLGIGFEPVFKVEVSGEVEFSATLTGSLGFVYDSDQGLTPLVTPCQVKRDFKAEVTVFIGFDLAPQIEAIEGILFEVKAEIPIGVELHITNTGNQGKAPEESDAIQHTCVACLDVNTFFKYEVAFTLEFAKWRSFSYTLISNKFNLGHSYFSIDHKEFGFGFCPYKAFRLTVTVTDSDGEPVPGASVSTQGESQVTNDAGIAIFQLPAGAYNITATSSQFHTSAAVTIEGARKLVLKPSDEEDSPPLIPIGNPGEILTSDRSYNDGYNCSWTLYDSGLLVISGIGPMDFDSTLLDERGQLGLVKQVVIGNGITTVSPYAFRDFYNMTNVTIPDSVLIIHRHAFDSCGLTSVTIPGSVDTISDYAFESSALTSVTIAEGVNSIGDYAFGNCSNLTHLTIGNSVSYIGFQAFCDCDSLTSVTIPDSVRTISPDAFYDCDSLTDVTIGGGTIGVDSFALCDSLTNVTIGSRVSAIDDSAFHECDSLLRIDIPDSVTSIGESAFRDCDSLLSVTIGNGVTSIKDYSFEGCDALTTVTIGDSVTSIGDSAFGGCGLTDVTIPDSVTSIGNYAFKSCENLPSVIIPDSVTSIGEYAFLYCHSLSDVTIGSHVETIGDSAFGGCGLTDVTIPDSVTSIGEHAFAANHNLTSLSIGNGVKTIGNEAFAQCMNLADLTIGSRVETIGDRAFRQCTSLTAVTIPDSVTAIGSEAFNCCENLFKVSIGSGVTTIGAYAFDLCFRLTHVYYGGTEAQWAQIAIDTGNAPLADAIIHFDDSELPPDDDDSGDNPPDNDENSATFGECGVNGSNLAWSLDDTGLLRISGTGAMEDFNFIVNTPPWNEYLFAITEIFIEDGVTTIGSDAFYGAYELTSLTLPDSLISIGAGAFTACDMLAQVTIPASVTSIGATAFSYCNRLQSFSVDQDNPVYSSDEHGVLFDKDKLLLIQAPGGISNSYAIPDTVTAIGSHAFAACIELTGVTIPHSVTSIGNSAFSYCDSLQSISVDENNPNYSNDAQGVLFDKEKNTLISVPSVISGAYVVPNGVTSIDYSAFSSCYALTHITLPDSMTAIDAWTFSYSSLTSIDIPSSITAIGDYAFDSCYELTDVYYGGTEAQWQNISIGEFNEPLTQANIHYGAAAPTTVSGTSSHLLSIPLGGVALITDDMPKDEPGASTNASYGGYFGTVTYDDCTLNTALFVGLVPHTQYVMLVLRSADADDLLSSDNLLFIDQAAASAEGTLYFRYSQPEIGGDAYVVVCGTSNRSLKDAEITFHEMTADGTLQAVNPTVVYDGMTLVEGKDYVISGEVSFTEAGIYTCSIRGIRNYTGTVACSYTVSSDGSEPDILYGDANGDSKVNGLDLILLRQHLAGWDVELDTASADVNGNGTINGLDLILLRQHLAGWDVTLGPQ